jgi:hypothetical protein
MRRPWLNYIIKHFICCIVLESNGIRQISCGKLLICALFLHADGPDGSPEAQ